MRVATVWRLLQNLMAADEALLDRLSASTPAELCSGGCAAPQIPAGHSRRSMAWQQGEEWSRGPGTLLTPASRQEREQMWERCELRKQQGHADDDSDDVDAESAAAAAAASPSPRWDAVGLFQRQQVKQRRVLAWNRCVEG
jgi:hypothetical protein